MPEHGLRGVGERGAGRALAPRRRGDEPLHVVRPHLRPDAAVAAAAVAVADAAAAELPAGGAVGRSGDAAAAAVAAAVAVARSLAPTAAGVADVAAGDHAVDRRGLGDGYA